MTDELKPCPFCGGDARIAKYATGEIANVKCVLCGAFIWRQSGAGENPITAWNTRESDARAALTHTTEGET